MSTSDFAANKMMLILPGGAPSSGQLLTHPETNRILNPTQFM